MKELFSTSNPQVKQWRQLLTPSGRKKHGLFLAEGIHLATEAQKAGCATTLLVSKEHLDQYPETESSRIPTYLVSRQVLAALTDSKTPQGIVAVCLLPDAPQIQLAGSYLVALNCLQDPGNVGTILRTLDAAAFDGMLIDPGCADPFSPKALRASMGAVFRVPVYVCESLPDALASLPNYTIVAGDLHGSPYYEHGKFGEKVCLLVGNEGAGLDRELLQMAHHRLKLPIPGGAESLNAAVAAGLMIYDVMLNS